MSNSTNVVREATRAGAMAARDRKPLFTCPYDVGSEDRKDWNKAWYHVDNMCDVVTGFVLQGREVNVVPVDKD